MPGAQFHYVGDDEKVYVWDVAKKKRTQLLDDHAHRWGQITCLAWFDQIGHQEGVRNVLAFGSGRGLLVMYRQTRPEVCIFLKLCCIKSLMQSLESDGRALNNPCL